jgi:hypothetical protein
MPNEAERILIPYMNENADLLPMIDSQIRNKTDIQEILKITDVIILKERFGFSDQEIQLAQNIWKKLSSRRLNRGK